MRVLSLDARLALGKHQMDALNAPLHAESSRHLKAQEQQDAWMHEQNDLWEEEQAKAKAAKRAHDRATDGKVRNVFGRTEGNLRLGPSRASLDRPPSQAPAKKKPTAILLFNSRTPKPQLPVM